MPKVFIQKMKAMNSKYDWIDELSSEVNEDDLTYFQMLTTAIYKSRQGSYYWWQKLIAEVEDDERTEEESINPQSYTQGAANRMTKKRIKRDG